jgi:hypothetical protein
LKRKCTLVHRSFALVVFLLVGASVEAGTINLAWNPSTDPTLGGYYLLSGTQSGVYTNSINVGKVTSGQITVADGQTYYLAVEAYDTSGLTSAPSNEVVTPLSLGNPGAQTSAEGAAVSLQLIASTVAGRVLTFGAIGLPPALSVNATSGVITGTLPYTAAGVYPVTVSATAGTAASASASFVWTINNTDRPPVLTNPGAQTSASGSTVALALAATDPDGDAVTFGATGLPPGLQLNAATGLVSGILSPAATGSYFITASASDGTLLVSQTFAWTVQAPHIAPVVTNPGNQSNTVGDDVALDILATDPSGNSMTFAATGFSPGLSFNAKKAKIHGTLRKPAIGTYTVTVAVSDGIGTSLVSFGWTVTAR